MLCRIVDRKAPEKISCGIVVDEFGFAERILHGVGPDGVVARIESNSEHGKKMIAARGNEIRTVTVRSDLHDFLLCEAAEVKDLAIGVPGETFRNEIFFFADKTEARLGDGGKFAMNFFDELGEFMRSVESQKFAFARWIKTFAE